MPGVVTQAKYLAKPYHNIENHFRQSHSTRYLLAQDQRTEVQNEEWIQEVHEIRDWIRKAGTYVQKLVHLSALQLQVLLEFFANSHVPMNW